MILPLTLAVVSLPRKPCYAPRTKTEGEKNIFYYSPSFGEMQRKTDLEMTKDAI